MSGPSLGIQRWQNLAVFIQEMIKLTISLSDAFATSKIDDDHGVGGNDDEDDIYIMMSVCLSEKSSLLGFSWFLVGFHGF